MITTRHEVLNPHIISHRGGRQLGAKVQGDHMFTRSRRFVCQRCQRAAEELLPSRLSRLL